MLSLVAVALALSGLGLVRASEQDKVREGGRFKAHHGDLYLCLDSDGWMYFGPKNKATLMLLKPCEDRKDSQFYVSFPDHSDAVLGYSKTVGWAGLLGRFAGTQASTNVKIHISREGVVTNTISGSSGREGYTLQQHGDWGPKISNPSGFGTMSASQAFLLSETGKRGIELTWERQYTAAEKRQRAKQAANRRARKKREAATAKDAADAKAEAKRNREELERFKAQVRRKEQETKPDRPVPKAGPGAIEAISFTKGMRLQLQKAGLCNVPKGTLGTVLSVAQNGDTEVAWESGKTQRYSEKLLRIKVQRVGDGSRVTVEAVPGKAAKAPEGSQTHPARDSSSNGPSVNENAAFAPSMAAAIGLALAALL